MSTSALVRGTLHQRHSRVPTNDATSSHRLHSIYTESEREGESHRIRERVTERHRVRERERVRESPRVLAAPITDQSSRCPHVCPCMDRALFHARHVLKRGSGCLQNYIECWASPGGRGTKEGAHTSNSDSARTLIHWSSRYKCGAKRREEAGKTVR